MVWVVIAALIFDALIGDPDWLWRRLPHPVTLFGRLIAWLEGLLNRDMWSPLARRVAGGLAVIVLLIVVVGISAAIESLLGTSKIAIVVKGLIASTLIAQRSLYQHVAQVRDAFSDHIDQARRAVSMIVGRDPDAMDEPAICRAAIESCAENFSDGIVAPVFWLALLGLPGLFAYKAINTADSMIGHRNVRYENFGWAAARSDDLVNLVPARLSGLLIALVAPCVNGSITTALKVMWQDARKHRSPNAGWPESAMAAVLGVALAGPRRYGGHVVNDAFINATGRQSATPNDIGFALKLLVAACTLQAAIYVVLAIAV